MGNVVEPVTRQSLQFARTILKSIAGVALVGAFLPAAGNDIGVEGKALPGAQNAQRTKSQAQEFYISLATDERDQSGLSTLVVAGSNRFMFDCEVANSLPEAGDGTAPMTALFLTHLDTTTAAGIGRTVIDAPAAPPLRIWGPLGTRKWILETVGNRESDTEHRPFTVIDVREGGISETGNVTIAAIEMAPSMFAYRVGFEGRSLLIAASMTFSEHLVARSAGVDIVVLRHSDITETIKLLQRIKPRLAVLSPDGLPATVAQIRQHYAGPLQLLGAGAHRIHVRERLALDDDIKWPQR